MAFQIRVIATCRLVNRSTGSMPGKLFQISTSRAPGHFDAKAASSSTLLNVSVPSPFPSMSFEEAKTVMLFSGSIVNVGIHVLFLNPTGRKPAVDDIHRSTAQD
jgi:hypothetical protein